MPITYRTVLGIPLTNAQVDANFQFLEDGKLDLAGGTLTGFLTLSGAPSSSLHAATKLYVDGQITTLGNGRVLKAGDTMTGDLTLAGAPTAALHATSKTYVDTKLAIDGSVNMTGKLTLVASSGSIASVRLISGGADPGTPISGDLWNNLGVLKFYDGSTTKQILFAGDAVSSSTTADRWTTPRTITLGTDLTGNVSIDGSAPVTLNATLANNSVVTAKILDGNVTAAKLSFTPVTSITGTANQIIVGGTAAVPILTTPQSIGTTSSVQHGSLGIGTPASGVSGEIRATNEVTAYYTSDARLKENVYPIYGALSKLHQIRGVEFDWKAEVLAARGGEDAYFVRRHDVGVIAQEVEAVLPEVVATREDGTLAVRYEKMVSLLIEAVKELSDKVTHLEKVTPCQCSTKV